MSCVEAGRWEGTPPRARSSSAAPQAAYPELRRAKATAGPRAGRRRARGPRRPRRGLGRGRRQVGADGRRLADRRDARHLRGPPRPARRDARRDRAARRPARRARRDRRRGPVLDWVSRPDVFAEPPRPARPGLRARRARALESTDAPARPSPRPPAASPSWSPTASPTSASRGVGLGEGLSLRRPRRLRHGARPRRRADPAHRVSGGLEAIGARASDPDGAGAPTVTAALDLRRQARRLLVAAWPSFASDWRKRALRPIGLSHGKDVPRTLIESEVKSPAEGRVFEALRDGLDDRGRPSTPSAG